MRTLVGLILPAVMLFITCSSSDEQAPAGTVVGGQEGDDGGSEGSAPGSSSDATTDEEAGTADASNEDASSDGSRDVEVDALDGGDDASVDAGQDVDAAPPPVVTTQYVTLTFGGRTRGYYLSVPWTYSAAKSYPLVVMFHGNPSSATELLSVFHYEDVSGQDAILAYPDAVDGNWDLSTPAPQNRDMTFVQALPAEIAKTYAIDTARVYGFGFSGGAFFVNQFACRLTGIFKAMTSHSGGAPFENGNPPKDPQGYLICPGGPKPFLVIHGEADTNVAPGGSEYAARHWAHVNGCQNTRVAASPPPCQSYVGCPANAPVTYCSIPDLPHAPWSGAMAASWQFFRSVP